MKKRVFALMLAAMLAFPAAVHGETRETEAVETEAVRETEETETTEASEAEETESAETEAEETEAGTEAVEAKPAEKGAAEGPIDLSNAEEAYRDMEWDERSGCYIFKDENGGTTLLDPDDPEFIKNVFGTGERSPEELNETETTRQATGTSVYSPYTNATYTLTASKTNATVMDLVDVSSHQGTVNWTAVKNAGIDGVIVRIGYRGASDGVLHEDTNWRANITGAKAAGLKVGGYVYSQAITTAEASSEAALAITCLSGIAVDLPVFIDYEYYGTSGRLYNAKLSPDTHQTICNAFCTTMKNAKYTPGIYANRDMLNNDMRVSNTIAGTKYWLARYSTSTGYSGSFDFWQYTSKGSVSGITGNADCSFWIKEGLAVEATASPAEILIYEDGTGTSTLKATSAMTDATFKWTVVSAENRKGKSVDASKIATFSGDTGATITMTAKNPGKVTMRVTATKGTQTAYADITVKVRGRLTEDNTELNTTSFPFNGKERKPKAYVTFGDSELTEGTDYTITYNSNKRVGTAMAIIEGKGYFSGVVSEPFTITPLELNANAGLTIGKIPQKSYSPKGLTPTTTIKLGSTTLSAVRDYKIRYQKPDGEVVDVITEVGTYIPVIEAQPDGVFTGSYAASDRAFTVEARKISSSDVFLSETMINDGSVAPDVTVAVDTATLELGKDYTVTTADYTGIGSYSVVVTGTGNYQGTITQKYSVVPVTKKLINTQSCDISLAREIYTFNGKARKPGVTVVSGNRKLTKDTDYTVTYKRQKTTGTAFAVVKGIGAYSGIANVPYEISPVTPEVSAVKVTLSARKYNFAAKVCRPKVKVTAGGKELKDSTDYTVSFSNPNSRDAGSYEVVLSFRGEIEGELSLTYTIKRISLSGLTITLPDQEYEGGDAIEPEKELFTYKLGSKFLTYEDLEGLDIVKYSNNKKVTTDTPAKAVMESNGTGNFTDGSKKTVEFQIKK